jgi:hypothetical protein
MRKEHPALQGLNRQTTAVEIAGEGHTIALRRWAASSELIALFHFSSSPETIELEAASGAWRNRARFRGAEVAGRRVGHPSHAWNRRDANCDIELPAKSCVVLDSGANDEGELRDARAA